MHIAFIPDGNRRWAKQRFLAAQQGHKEGSERFDYVLHHCSKLGVKKVTFWALSTENYNNRSSLEINYILDLFEEYLDKKTPNFITEKTRFKILGDVLALPEKLKIKIDKVEKLTQNYQELLLQVCLNYGGKNEIIRAAKKLFTEQKELNENTLEKYLDTSECPDLVIRTGGCQRISNFLLWQTAYSEWYFTPKLWPDFDNQDLEQAIEFYKKQQRNFGK